MPVCTHEAYKNQYRDQNRSLGWSFPGQPEATDGPTCKQINVPSGESDDCVERAPMSPMSGCEQIPVRRCERVSWYGRNELFFGVRPLRGRKRSDRGEIIRRTCVKPGQPNSFLKRVSRLSLGK